MNSTTYPGLAATVVENKLVNWKKLSGVALMKLLPVALVLAIMNIAGQAIALQKLGSTGADVTTTQRCLKQLGYYNGPVTGKFATLTEAAVRRYQQKNGLAVDGEIGTRTQNLLNSQCQSRTNPPVKGSGVLQFGSKGAAVSQLQQNLRSLRFYNGPINGNFGTLTQQAVIRFQQTYRISADGVAGTRTLRTISAALKPIGTGGDSLPNALNRGDSGALVRQLQDDLRRLGYFKVNSTGNFGKVTEDAVARFQSNYGLPPNGVADARTLGAISQALLSSDGKNGCSQANGEICPGERSQRVATVQQRLNQWGFYNGNIDGYYGAGTRDAVGQFQRYFRLAATGFVDFNTWQALTTTANAPKPNIPNPSTTNRYVVVVPMFSNDTLNRIQQLVPRAIPGTSKLGNYVNAGAFSQRGDAESLSKQLRDRGFDARVEYF
ncbi:peptidoglycan-binding protein [Calothrix sp. PCC 6303]|uniref:peptidoglycan-binding domain-containing protein n=1 Tax=Calothrix sp. PCC 6303 TaxID=1170562 RepID=UPI0002A027F6|nr:peptidoglycan-binding protein [Calothrix sp. PCC 6303]AFZ03257.1 Peptidoglycan-binding domain 1 protein [Calothrix sp. PCC 6303]